MKIFLIIFSLFFVIYGIITKNTKGFNVMYNTFSFYKSKYFIQAKFISHIFNFIYSIMLIYLLYKNILSDYFALTIPLVYFTVIHLSTQIYEKKGQH